MNGARAGMIWAATLALAWACAAPAAEGASPLFTPEGMIGEVVSSDIDRMYEKGLRYLQRAQAADGVWTNPGGEQGPAINGLCLLALVAEGGDPRHGPHAATIRRGLDALLRAQDANGYFGPSMYHHGFATLALAELYGAVDDARLGPALAKAVRLILDAQTKSQPGGWRYSPTSTDADTTVSGAQLVALFAARNAGLEVPEAAIERALEFYRRCQDAAGGIGYTEVGGGSGPRNAIAVLVAALAQEHESRLFRGAWTWLRSSGEDASGGYLFYYYYYAAQAWFRADMAAWRTWNRQTADRLLSTQNAQGGWDGPQGSTFCTATAMLSMALNYRFLPIYER